MNKGGTVQARELRGKYMEGPRDHGIFGSLHTGPAHEGVGTAGWELLRDTERLEWRSRQRPKGLTKQVGNQDSRLKSTPRLELSPKLDYWAGLSLDSCEFTKVVNTCCRTAQ